MQEIQVFNNPEFGDIRTVVIDDEPWFVGKDVAAALGYARPTDAARNNTDSEDKGVSEIATPSGTQKMLIVNESGLYSLIFGSKLESARKFKKWVTSEVLPTIRKTGSYGQKRLSMTIPEQIQLLAQGNVEIHQRIDKLDAKLEKSLADLPILGIEETKISNAVKKRGVECLGGKESNACNDKSLRGRLYSDLHRELRRQFGGISTYKAIKRSQCATALSIVESYEPPLILKEQIKNSNAQMKIDMGVA